MAPSASRRFLAAAVLIPVIVVFAAQASWATPDGNTLTAAQRQSLQAGIQVAPKAPATAKGSAALPNPYLAELPDLTKADYAGWRERMAAAAVQRASSTRTRLAKAKAIGRAVPDPLVHLEKEASGDAGQNDSKAAAERIPGFGTGPRDNPRVQVLGNLAEVSVTPVPLAPGAEDNGQINQATETQLDGRGAVETTGVLGDGPHGSAGTATNDFDFYQLRSTAGETVRVDTSGSPTDTVAALYDAEGNLLGIDDDGGDTALTSKLSVRLTAGGTFYAMVAGYSELGSLPADPHDAASGAGGGKEGAYNLTLSSLLVDTDFYELDLVKGDVVGATVFGSATTLRMFRTDGTRMVGAVRVDATSLYPPESPLPGGGNTTLAYVAEGSGRYAIQLDGPKGAYDATIEGYRPGSEIDRSSRHVQTVFLDFDGARVNTAIWGGPGVRALSPFSSFLSGWGLSPSDEPALIQKITAGVRENIEEDIRAKSLNHNVAVRVLNSYDHADVFGEENVSRVIIGGTVSESGIETIGISQYIDPGNYGHEDSAVVLLDLLTDSDTSVTASLNTYLNGDSDRVGFVAQALSNLVAHEVGHMIGNFHTDPLNGQISLMDAGGFDFGALFGVGPDRVGGTADDADVDFVTDDYSPNEAFNGMENTLNIAAWAHVGQLEIDP